jgi:Family of unknown function (DUF5309)
MATIAKGLIATQESAGGILQDSMVIDMREEISMADEDETQFTTFTMNASSGEATREKINWREKDYFPRTVTASAAYTNVATSVVLTAGHGNRVRPGDVLRNMPGGDAMWVQSVSGDTLTVVRNIGAKTGQAGNIGDTLLIASNASPQGADYPSTAVLSATLGFNYTQIFRHGASFSRTARAVNYYGRSEPDQESALKGIEQKRAIEYTGFWGARDQKYDAVPPTGTGEVIGFAGGLVEFITTNKNDVAGSLTVDYLDNWLRTTLQRSSRNVVMYVAPIVAQQISKFNRGGQGTNWRADPQNRAGLKVDAFMSGVYGYEIPVVVKKDWNDFPTTLKQYGGWLFVVDMNRVQYKNLTGGSTKLLTNRQHPGADRVSEEWLTECTWEIRNEASHGILYGIT